MNKDYYQILGLNHNCTQEDIRKAYRLNASKFHPDKHQGDKFFEEKFKEIKEAYEFLSDDYKRKKYDNQFFKSSDSTFKEPPRNTYGHTSQQEKRTNFSSKTKTNTRETYRKPRTNKQQRRQKHFVIGIGTALAFVLLMEIGGKNGLHVPIAMGFLFWTIRQIWVVIVSYISD